MKYQPQKIFLAIKGFGDFFILANFLRDAQDKKNIQLIASRRFSGWAKLFIPDIKTHWVAFDGFPAFYDLKRFRFKDLLADLKILLTIRAIIKNNDATLHLDFKNIKDQCLFINIKKSYIANQGNLYLGFTKLFQSQKTIIIKSQPKIIYIFPKGSYAAKVISETNLNLICHALMKVKIKVRVVLNPSEINFYPNLEENLIKTYQNAGALKSLMSDCDAILTTDTASLHLAILLGKSFFVWGPYDKRMLPEFIDQRYLVKDLNELSKLYELSIKIAMNEWVVSLLALPVYFFILIDNHPYAQFVCYLGYLLALTVTFMAKKTFKIPISFILGWFLFLILLMVPSYINQSSGRLESEMINLTIITVKMFLLTSILCVMVDWAASVKPNQSFDFYPKLFIVIAPISIILILAILTPHILYPDKNGYPTPYGMQHNYLGETLILFTLLATQMRATFFKVLGHFVSTHSYFLSQLA